MKYDFDKIIDRSNTNSCKWDVLPNELPMWVADMDFQTAPEIIEALIARAKHGIFGYSIVPDAWYEAYINWWSTYHQLIIKKEWLVFTTGVIPAISSMVRKLTTPGEKVLVQTPVYNIFFNSILNNGRFVLENPLVYDGDNYQIDFVDLEAKLADEQTTLMILCNPHNPIGKIWTKEELTKISLLCEKYHVLVISDEIHCDLTDPSENYIPYASLSDVSRNHSITCLSTTKTFNLAGLQNAAVVIPNPVIRHKVTRALNTDEVAEPNAFAIDATITAFTKGKAWLEELKAYLYQNKMIVKNYLAKELPTLKLISSKATYLLWLDISSLGKSATEVAEFIRKKTGLYVSDGSQYRGNGTSFLRINIACPKKTLQDGLERLKYGIHLLQLDN